MERHLRVQRERVCQAVIRDLVLRGETRLDLVVLAAGDESFVDVVDEDLLDRGTAGVTDVEVGRLEDEPHCEGGVQIGLTCRGLHRFRRTCAGAQDDGGGGERGQDGEASVSSEHEVVDPLGAAGAVCRCSRA